MTNRPIKRIRVLHGSEVVKRQGLAQRQVAGGVTGGLARTKPTIPIATPGGGDAGEGGEGLAYIGEDDDRLTLTPAMAGSTVLFQLSYVPVDETLDLRIHYGGTAADDGGLLDPSLYTVTEDGVVKIAWQSAWGLALDAGLTLELSARYLREEGAEPEAYNDLIAVRGVSLISANPPFTSMPMPTTQAGDLLVLAGYAKDLVVSDPRLTQIPGANMWFFVVSSDFSPLQVAGSNAAGAHGHALSAVSYYSPNGGALVVAPLAASTADAVTPKTVPATSYGSAILGAYGSGGIGGVSITLTGAGWTETANPANAYAEGPQYLATSADEDATTPSATLTRGGSNADMGWGLLGVRVIAE